MTIREVAQPAGRSYPSPRALVLALRGALGRYLSIRAKLTVWYGLMVALTLVLTGLGMRSYLNQQINSDIDRRLVTSAAQTAAALHNLSQPRAVAGPPLQAGTCPYADASVQVYCGQISKILNKVLISLASPGQFENVLVEPAGPANLTYLSSNTTPPGHKYLLDSSALPLVLQTFSKHESQFVNETVGNERVRGYLQVVTPPRYVTPGTHVLLAVFLPEHVYTRVLDLITLTLLLGLPIGLLIALVSGWWIARFALRPIDRISRTVQRIGTSQDLSLRLNNVGPQDEVGRLAETFDHMMGKLEGVFDAQKRFIGDASHELRTPLTAIRGNADLLAIAPEDERDLALSAIRREAERMTRMLSDLLLLAEADAEEQTIHRRPVQLGELLSEVHRSARLLAGDRVAVTLDVPEPLTVPGDTDRLKQVFLNLVDNAVKFTPDEGVVGMTLARDGDNAVVSVSDTGPGVPEAEREAVFRRFYRVEQSRSKRGTGLGLAICAWIVEAHGGTIDVAGNPGEGSVFTVTLPMRWRRRDQQPAHEPKAD